MAAGGKAIVVTTYTDQDMTNFKSILDEYGVSVTKGILAETDNGHYYQNPFYLIPEVKSNTYTSDFADSKYVFAPYAQGLTVSENDALSVTQMLVTSENAVVKDDPQNMTSYESEDGDETGQFTLGAKVEKRQMIQQVLCLYSLLRISLQMNPARWLVVPTCSCSHV